MTIPLTAPNNKFSFLVEPFVNRNMRAHSQQCADAVLEAIPLIMRSIRKEMRSHRDSALSVPQFRALAFAGMNRGTTLSELAGHLGLRPPAASKIVDGLVESGLMDRQISHIDRRCICLALTSPGQTQLQRTRRMASECLAEMFVLLTATECEQITSVMLKLQDIFK